MCSAHAGPAKNQPGLHTVSVWLWHRCLIPASPALCDLICHRLWLAEPRFILPAGLPGQAPGKAMQALPIGHTLALIPGETLLMLTPPSPPSRPSLITAAEHTCNQGALHGASSSAPELQEARTALRGFPGLIFSRVPWEQRDHLLVKITGWLSTWARYLPGGQTCLTELAVRRRQQESSF